MYKAVTDDVTLLVMLTKTRLPDTEANRSVLRNLKWADPPNTATRLQVPNNIFSRFNVPPLYRCFLKPFLFSNTASRLKVAV